MKRRTLLAGLSTLPALWAMGPRSAAAARTQPDIERLRAEWQKLLPADFDAPRPGNRLELGADEWRERLTSAQFDVLRDADTEPAFSSPLNDEHRDGVYVCAGCNLPLFTSEMKFDSGTGWPSFFTTIPDVFETERDFVLLIPRTEYHCVRCKGHHGHVFDDGPPPTDERWCNNGVALRFVPAA